MVRMITVTHIKVNDVEVGGHNHCQPEREISVNPKQIKTLERVPETEFTEEHTKLTMTGRRKHYLLVKEMPSKVIELMGC